MPFTDPEPLRATWWVILLAFVALIDGFLGILSFKKDMDKNPEGTQQPYAGHHYERRQAKKIL